MLFILCEMYSIIASLQFFELSEVTPIYVTHNIRELWTRRLSPTKRLYLPQGIKVRVTCGLTLAIEPIERKTNKELNELNETLVALW